MDCHNSAPGLIYSGTEYY